MTTLKGQALSGKMLADLITKPILTNHRCPQCNSRVRHLGNRLYRCGHCKVHYRLVMESVKMGLVKYQLQNRHIEDTEVK